MMRELILGRDKIGRKTSIYYYRDGDKVYTDLHTDGRILLTPTLAKKIAKKLNAFANADPRISEA